MTEIPADIMREAECIAFEYALAALEVPATSAIARAILAAEERATQRERERCAAAVGAMIDGAYVGKQEVIAIIMQKENGE